MLSATLDSPEIFAKWCENINKNKEVYLITLKERAVPLSHYSFITCNESFFKKIKDKELEKEIREVINKPFLLKENDLTNFNEINYRKINKVLKNFSQYNKINRSFVLNQLCKYLFDNQMLPCACFILSRKQLEIAAKEITVPLLVDDSKTPYIIKNRCEKLLREKLSNYEEFIQLPEYISMISLLEKGIATHHSGTIPILKEIVELLFVEGYIQLLFCTETFSCGLNMPIKTTIFTDIHKFDGTDFRLLHGYEYNQASGRAGRRGLDTKGYVIHLNNLFKREVNIADYKIMMSGKPQKLISHYKISYQLVLSSIKDIVNKSLFKTEINTDISIQNQIKIEKLNDYERIRNSIQYLNTKEEDMIQYIGYTNIVKTLNNKKRKEMERNISLIKERNHNLDMDINIYNKMIHLKKELEEMDKYKYYSENYFNNKIDKIIYFLEENEYMKEGNVTVKGELLKSFKEVPCIIFSLLIFNKEFEKMDYKDIGIILSCFTNINVSSEQKCIERPFVNEQVERTIKRIEIEILKVLKFENNNNINTGDTYDIQFDLLEYIVKWMEAETVEECKWVLQIIKKEKGIFLGEFVKAMLKIIAIATEIQNACEIINDLDLLTKIKKIIEKIQKYIVTNQSLYI
jgi:superfamily II RNA helicase